MLIACGDDPYSGTWRSTTLFEGEDGSFRSQLVIEKVDDGWTVTDVMGRSFLNQESDGGLVAVKGPSGESVDNGKVLRLEGDRLVLFAGGSKEMEFIRE
jgi:hypothetical protein